MRELHVFVSGKVQGVSYRDFVLSSATGLGLVGYVRNLPNGAVKVMAQGEEMKLSAFLEILHKGPALSLVEDVKIEWREASNMYPAFQIEY